MLETWVLLLEYNGWEVITVNSDGQGIAFLASLQVILSLSSKAYHNAATSFMALKYNTKVSYLFVSFSLKPKQNSLTYVDKNMVQSVPSKTHEAS